MGLKLKNCPQCGKLFAVKGGHKLCYVCRTGEENDFQKVKEYLWENPNATIELVHEETGVSRERIIKFIREDRLIAEGLHLDFFLECERCGQLIDHGRFCKTCQGELISGFKPATSNRSKKEQDEKKTTDSYNKMHLFDRINRRNR